jgi:ABC-type transport system involved in cytochrome bd biosynthesis fused ATPase/permease subunit
MACLPQDNLNVVMIERAVIPRSAAPTLSNTTDEALASYISLIKVIKPSNSNNNKSTANLQANQNQANVTIITGESGCGKSVINYRWNKQ